MTQQDLNLMNLREKLKNFFEPPVVGKVRTLILMARELGLPDQDIQNAEEMLQVNEWGVGFDTVVTQMHEYDVTVTEDFVHLAKEIMADMRIEESEYAFLHELSRRASTK